MSVYLYVPLQLCICSDDDESFTINSGMPVAAAAVCQESHDVSIEDLADDDDVDEGTTTDARSPTYEVLEGGTKRARPKLVSSDGFSYSVKRRLVRHFNFNVSLLPIMC